MRLAGHRGPPTLGKEVSRLAKKPKKPGAAKGPDQVRQAQNYEKQAQGWLAKAAGVFVLAIFLIHPFFMNPTTYYTITEAKDGFFRLSAILFLLFSLFIVATIPGFFRLPPWRQLAREVRLYEWPLLAYGLLLLLATLFADSVPLAVWGGSTRNEGLLMMSLYLLVCVAVGRLFRPRDGALLVLCGAAALVAAYGICQHYGLDFLGINPPVLEGQIGQQMVFFSTMSNRNVASTYLCLAFCVCVGMFTAKTRPAHWAFLPLGLVIFYGELLARTESGYLGLFVSIAFLFPLLARTARQAARFFAMMAGCLGALWVETTVSLRDPIFQSYFAFTRPYLLPGALAVLAVAAVLYFVKLPPLPPRVGRWLPLVWCLVVLAVAAVVLTTLVPYLAQVTENASLDELAAILQGDFQDQFMSGRMMAWKRALSMIPQRLLLGHGPDNFARSFNAVHEEAIYAAQHQVFDKLHNEYLQILFDNGLPALLAMLAFYGTLIYGAAKKSRDPMVLGILLALVCHMVQAFFNFVSPFAHPITWTLWGVLGALLYRDGGQDPAPQKKGS